MKIAMCLHGIFFYLVGEYEGLVNSNSDVTWQ